MPLEFAQPEQTVDGAGAVKSGARWSPLGTIGEQVMVDAPHLVRPFFVVGVEFTLVQQGAFDDTVLLHQLRHLDEMQIRASAV